VRVQPGNHLRPVAEICDPLKEEISSARKEVKRKTYQQKKPQSNGCTSRAAKYNL
jgi:hypothetical protein